MSDGGMSDDGHHNEENRDNLHGGFSLDSAMDE